MFIYDIGVNIVKA